MIQQVNEQNLVQNLLVPMQWLNTQPHHGVRFLALGSSKHNCMMSKIYTMIFNKLIFYLVACACSIMVKIIIENKTKINYFDLLPGPLFSLSLHHHAKSCNICWFSASLVSFNFLKYSKHFPFLMFLQLPQNYIFNLFFLSMNSTKFPSSSYVDWTQTGAGAPEWKCVHPSNFSFHSPLSAFALASIPWNFQLHHQQLISLPYIKATFVFASKSFPLSLFAYCFPNSEIKLHIAFCHLLLCWFCSWMWIFIFTT